MPRAPALWRGTLRHYISDYLDAALPPPEVAVPWHDAVTSHARTTAPLLVRMTSGFKQEATTHAGGRALRMTDNAAPWWIHAAAFSGSRPPAAGLGSILADIWCWMFRAHRGTQARPGNANEAGWYVAHILRAKPDGDGPPERWDEFTACRRFIRNLSPLNHFLVPKGNGADIGERAAVIATVADWYRQRYGVAFQKFLDESGGGDEFGRPNWDLEIEVIGPGGRVGEKRTSRGAVRRQSTRVATPSNAFSVWSSVLATSERRDRRAEILSAAPDAQQRLLRLVDGLSVRSFVSIANALFNRCDPADLAHAAPRGGAAQACLAWAFLDEAKANPRLGGKWARVVVALEPGSEHGLAVLACCGLDDVVAAALRVVSQVYRRL